MRVNGQACRELLVRLLRTIALRVELVADGRCEDVCGRLRVGHAEMSQQLLLELSWVVANRRCVCRELLDEFECFGSELPECGHDEGDHFCVLLGGNISVFPDLGGFGGCYRGCWVKQKQPRGCELADDLEVDQLGLA